MIVQHNMAALNTNRMLGTAGRVLSKSTEKLSSGYRINRAADDAAGLAISEKMRGQIRGLNRASGNAQDGISLIQTAEGALNETQNILQRMRELTVQAANETNTEDDRAEIQKEINQLTSEINRIGNTTEYNTMKLLKGNTKDAVTSDMDIATLKDAVVVAAEGSVSELTVKQASTIGKASTTTIQGNSSKTTAAFKDPKLSVAGVSGRKATTTFVGLTFTAKDSGTTLNGANIKIRYDENNTGAGSAIATGTAGQPGYEIELVLGKAAMDDILATGDEQKAAVLMSKLNSLTGTGALASVDITIELPEDENTNNDVSLAIEQLQAGNTKSSTMGNGRIAVAAEYKISVESMAKEAGDTITIAGTTLIMAKGGTSNTAAGEVDLDSANFYKDLADAFNAANEKFEMSFVGASTTGSGMAAGAANVVMVLKERDSTNIAGLNGDDYLGKTSLSDINIQAKGSGTDDILTISDKNGQNLVQFKFTSATSAAGTLAVSVTSGSAALGNVVVDVKLAAAQGGNTAELIQEAIRGLGNHAASGIDFREFEVTSSGNWDIDVFGHTTPGSNNANNLTTAWNSTSGGVQTKAGEYSFDITNSFAEGDVLTVGGKTFVAAKEASIRDGVFATGVSTKEQADNIVAALKASSLTDFYDIAVKGTKITLTEIKASGKDIEDPKVTDGASIKGEFSTKVDELLTDGASLVIDGETISVSSKNAHVGYDNGTAIKAAETLEDQTQALADAINKNAKLSEKYTASVGENGSLKLTQKVASDNVPTLQVTGSTKGDFTLKLQIGANTGQSMTVEIGDTRALALGVSGDGSVSTVKANNGSVASYVEIANVNSGSDNNNVEYALDVSDHDKATNALSVLDDALSYISSQRSSLGAYQNRLEYTIANLDNTAENLQTAESNIRDVNMAAEMVSFSKSNIIQQAAQSMLAQANQQTQGVLSLLR